MSARRHRARGMRYRAAALIGGAVCLVLGGMSPAVAQGVVSAQQGAAVPAVSPTIDPKNFVPGPCEGPDCPPVYPEIQLSDGPYRDDGVNVYAGEGISIAGTVAEMEGVIVTLGDFSVNKSNNGIYNVGYVGAGSKVSPHEGDDYLKVGGDLIVAEKTQLHAVGGAIRYAGERPAGGPISANLYHDKDAVAAYQGVNEALSARSKCVATQTATGKVKRIGDAFDFVGDGKSSIQVFNVEGSIANTINGKQERVNIWFDEIPDNATVIINMLGKNPIINTYAGDTQDLDGWNLVRDRLLWNFPNAETVSFIGFGQFQGSVLVGQPGSVSTMSMSGFAGRMFTVGKLVHVSNDGEFDGNFYGTGSEFHSYPFNGVLPNCAAAIPPNPPEEDTTISKVWVVNGETYQHGEQPKGMNATLVVNGQDRVWGQTLTGVDSNKTLTVDERANQTIPDNCVLDSSRITSINGEATDYPLPVDLVADEGVHTVTVTNTLTCKPRLTLIKEVAGGEAVPSDWSLIATPKSDVPQKEEAPKPEDPQGDESQSGAPQPEGDLPKIETPKPIAHYSVQGSTAGQSLDVSAGETYVLSESGFIDGYELKSLRCDIGKDGEFVETDEVTLKPFDHVTCVFTNGLTEIEIRTSNPKLTLIKKVDNGQNTIIRYPTDWTLYATGPDTISGLTGSDNLTEVEVEEGTYQLSESGPSGYSASDWECTGATSSTATSVTVMDGDHAVCTVTNTAYPDGVKPPEDEKPAIPPEEPGPSDPPSDPRKPSDPPKSIPPSEPSEPSKPLTPVPPADPGNPSKPPTPVPPADPGNPSKPATPLAWTGAEVGTVLLIGLALLGVGAALTVHHTRIRRTPSEGTGGEILK